MREVPTVAGQNITAIMEAEQSPVKNYLMAYHTFLGLWVMNFIEGISTMTICGAFAGWYWTVPSKELSSTICCGRKSMYLKRVQKDKFPVLASLYRAVRYHLGSIAFGSLIIAIVQFIRLVMEYINNKTKDLQEKSGFVKCLMCCVRCCLWCFEKCVKYITRNAYIVIATQGKTFCSATFTVFHILLNNVTTIGIATLVSSLVILLGKLL